MTTKSGVSVEILEIKAINKAKYGWSKYGGANYGLVTQEIHNTWYCQTCGEEQPEAIKPYMYEYFPRDYIRICSICYSKTQILKHPTVRKIVELARSKKRD